MPSLSLFVTHPTGEQTEHLLADEARVGRGAECEVRVASAYLSQVHFVLRREGDGYAVVSQHPAQTSTTHMRRPGTYVNGERVDGTRPLSEGDTISPLAEPGPNDPRFVLGPTQSPTPPDQLPQPAEASSMACAVIGLVVVAIVVILVVVLTR